MRVCDHHSPPVPDSGWNPSCHCYDTLQMQAKERFDNNSEWIVRQVLV